MPSRPAKPCRHPTCPNLRPCPTHPEPHRWGARDPFYVNHRWRHARARQLHTHPTCNAPGCAAPATEVDHVIGRRQGGAAYDPANLQSLCHHHHQEKTLAAAQRASSRR